MSAGTTRYRRTRSDAPSTWRISAAHVIHNAEVCRRRDRAYADALCLLPKLGSFRGAFMVMAKVGALGGRFELTRDGFEIRGLSVKHAKAPPEFAALSDALHRNHRFIVELLRVRCAESRRVMTLDEFWSIGKPGPLPQYASWCAAFA
jgi:hypothetical protein